jgi:hypothetical protein
VKWSRNDYVREEDDDDCWLMNPLWKVCPIIAFIDGIIKVITCKDHHNGDKRMMIHAC